MSDLRPNPLLVMLQQQLYAAIQRDRQIRERNVNGQLMQVPGTGKAISSAYEQLRNAAEYTEEHLLLQRAIRRFLNRTLSFSAQRNLGNIGEELVVELTQAGYLRNNTISHETAATILRQVSTAMHTYWRLREAKVSRDESVSWTLELLSADIEELLNPHSHLAVLAQFGYQHYLQLLPREALVTTATETEAYEISLYIAVHLSLLKSDLAIIRHDLVRMYQQSPDDLQAFIAFNRTISSLFSTPLTSRIKRYASKYGAPLRIVKSMIDDGADLPQLLSNRELFLDTYRQQVNKEYRTVKRRLTKGIIKSIIFIFITKIIIGLGVEIPYDLIMHGTVALLPLAINLLFPPLYMASLKLGLKVPSSTNASALVSYIDTTLYSQDQPVQPYIRNANQPIPVLSKIFYALAFCIPMAITVYILYLLHFNAAQAIIFFVFLSTASFLGFRLSRMVRELEIVTKQTGFLSTTKDFFYLPFILVGQWISSKYAKVNAVAYVLDIAIELPLKSVLRLLRQWTRFLNEKHEEIY